MSDGEDAEEWVDLNMSLVATGMQTSMVAAPSPTIPSENEKNGHGYWDNGIKELDSHTKVDSSAHRKPVSAKEEAIPQQIITLDHDSDSDTEAKDELEQLRAELERVRAENTTLVLSTEASTSALRQLRVELSEKDRAYERLSGSIGTLRLDLERRTRERNEFRGEVARLSVEMNEMAIQLTQLQDRLKTQTQTMVTSRPQSPQLSLGLSENLLVALAHAKEVMELMPNGKTKPTSLSPGDYKSFVSSQVDLENTVADSLTHLSEMARRAYETKLTIEDFEVGEIAIFFPLPKKPDRDRHFMAFSTKRCKVRFYLSQVSKDLVGQSTHFKDAYVMGRIIEKENCVATAKEEADGIMKQGTPFISVTVGQLPFE